MNPPAPDCAAHRSALLGAATVMLLVATLAVTLAPHADAPPLAPSRAALRINPNRASAAELMLLPGIGPRLAAEIIAYRAARPAPAFRSPADLDLVPHIGPTTCGRIAPHLVFADPDSAATPEVEPAARGAR